MLPTFYTFAIKRFESHSPGRVLHMHAVLQRVVGKLSKEVRGLDTWTVQQHPGGRTHEWTAQQVVEHLILSYRTTCHTLEARLKKGTNRKQHRTWLQWVLQVMVLSFGKLPSGVVTLDETRPEAGEFAAMNGEQLIDRLAAEMQLMDAAFERCRYRFGMEHVAVHPFLGPLRVDQWRRYHAIHGMHHVQQLRSVLSQVAPESIPVRIISPGLGKQLQVPAQRSLT